MLLLSCQSDHCFVSVFFSPDDMESSKCHLGAIIVRDYSIVISNYRSKMSLDEYCKQQNVLGIANLDTRAVTKELRETGCLVGVVTTDETKSDAELVNMAKSWTIVGKDLLSVVSCTEPYEWRQGTLEEWEFAAKAKAAAGGQPFHVSVYFNTPFGMMCPWWLLPSPLYLHVQA
jgi:carbamoyl-phosphate synthase small subunit